MKLKTPCDVRLNLLTLRKLAVLTTLFVLSLSIPAAAQLDTAFQPLPPDSVAQIEARLVALAQNGPSYRVSEHQNRINEYNLKRAKSSWLNLLSLSLNYNDQTFDKSAPTTAYVYPKYFFGFTLPLGIIFSKGNEIKAAREAAEVTKENQQQLTRDIRADVLSKYRQYRLYDELIAMQSEVVDDEQAALLQAEAKYREGKATIEAYNTSSKNYNAEVTKMLNLKMQQELLEIELERLIGTDLETVIRRR